MELYPHKAAILELLHRARSDQHCLLELLDANERAERGTWKRWSAKDMLAHLTAWQHHLTRRLAALLRDEEPPEIADPDQFNAHTYAEHHERPLADIMIDADIAFAELISHLNDCTERELIDSQRHPPLHGQPLWLEIVSSGYWHPQEHLAQFYRERGDILRATRIQEAIVETLSKLGSELPRGRLLYNLACFYATTGQPDRALPVLAESLQLQPDLVAWSRQDPDLAALRALSAYKALYLSQRT